MYGRDGRPLTILVESDLDDLRESVGSVGKYRLDPINDDGKAVESVPSRTAVRGAERGQFALARFWQ